ncbi:MAG: type II toxin-antitoxin system RelE/ParE family toxin [Propionibacteriaceae bacterium]|jgi:plasmid stabilization system protein ParE|nr:type II toxin-antitoxin system RelE/ParE family toxin [Propionibacteriaceae bacterium]
MSQRLRFHPAVASDLSEAADYYAQADPDLPRRLRADLRQSLDLVEAFPYLGGTIFEIYRHITLRRFPHLAVYRIKGDVVRVLAVVHTRRDPAWIQNTVRGRERSRAAQAATTVFPPELTMGDLS